MSQRTQLVMLRSPALVSAALVCLVAACGGAPKGPDGKTLPGGGAGAPPLADPRGEKPPPTAGVAQVVDLVKQKKAGGTANGETDVTVGGGAQLHIKWEKQADGSCKITVSTETSSSTFFVIPTPGGGPDQIKFDDGTFQGTLYGHHAVFYATAPGCTDLVWAQYFERTATFYNATGGKVGDAHHTGPAIDGQVPYQNQSHPGGGGNAWMEDDAGVNLPAGTSAKDGAPTALDTLKKNEGVTDGTITKADVTWMYWSYEICLNPYKVYGFYKWGYSVTVDVNNDPYINTHDPSGPTWEAAK